MISKKDFRKINNYLWEIPKDYRQDMRAPARVYASEAMLDDILRDRSIEQLINGATMPGIVKYAIAMPDCHQGYSVPIGFVGAIDVKKGVISPGATGFDINCGIRLLKSECDEKEIKPYLEQLAGEIQKQVPSGLGKGRKARLSAAQIDRVLEGGAEYLVKQGYGKKEDTEHCEAGGKLDWADASAVSETAKRRGSNQVGTLGSGNHFSEIQKVAKVFDKKTADVFGLFEGQVVIMLHSGSRGLGHQVCGDYLKVMIPAMRRYGIEMPDKEFACCPFSSKEGKQYFAAMAAAANYAWANRQMMTYAVRQAWETVLGQKSGGLQTFYDVAHNIVKKEKYHIDGKEMELAAHRKGATRAFPPGHPEVPVKYRKAGQPILIPGSMGTASYVLVGAKQAEEAFYSTSHGAGRTMSRRAAVREFPGREVVRGLKEKGILLKCHSFHGIAEEAPGAYKDVDKVVEVVHNAGLSRKVAKLAPLAVVKGE